MTKPTLMEIVSNWTVKYNTKAGKEYYVGAGELVEKKISHAFDKLYSYIAFIRLFVQYVVNENDIRVIKLDYNKKLYNIPDDKVTYNSFSDTPLYKRLEDLRFLKISLKDICNNKVEVINEIRSAVIKGFEKEVMNYHIDGVAAYPRYVLKPNLLPVADMNIGAIFSLNIKDTPIEEQSAFQKEKSAYIRQKYKEIQESTRTELTKRANNALDAMLEYFSMLLMKCHSINEISFILEWVGKYIYHNLESRLQHKINLPALLQYIPQLPDISINTSSNFKILYNIYGAPIYNVTRINDVIFLMKSFIIGALELVNIITDNILVEKYGMLPEIISTTYIYKGKKIGFLEGVFYYDKEELKKWIGKIPGEVLLNSLHSPYDIFKGISILQHMLEQAAAKPIFEIIAENCDINILARIANLEIRGGGDTIVTIHDAVYGSNFAKIVLRRLDEHGFLSHLKDQVEYCACAYGSKIEEAQNDSKADLLEEENQSWEMGAIMNLQSADE